MSEELDYTDVVLQGIGLTKWSLEKKKLSRYWKKQ